MMIEVEKEKVVLKLKTEISHTWIRNQRLMCLTLYHPFLHESPTTFTPFFTKIVSSLALSFTLCSNPAILFLLLFAF
ncbi:hypothetical protein GBA52_010521 [Prunus armeniaca]|nr:hypothetical protein GBA52_010521 [Prunus armeniaca]